ncbi:hypothetical protein PTT_06888 [Pyrenophora teres f. teres 0-1]|uniref:Uncharacterized protein n=1 Tax=Pyrenophora teres f. teres (strain 0-1) TaxID=861557 RepID=E3RGG1_PYRTT|nr:hypothetical protein PTT_06888 [Pyrenophora teres f. teres 0-1]
MQCEEQHQEEEEEEEAWKNRNNKKLKRHWTTRDASVMTATTRAPAASSRELPRWPRYLATSVTVKSAQTGAVLHDDPHHTGATCSSSCKPEVKKPEATSPPHYEPSPRSKPAGRARQRSTGVSSSPSSQTKQLPPARPPRLPGRRPRPPIHAHPHSARLDWLTARIIRANIPASIAAPW